MSSAAINIREAIVQRLEAATAFQPYGAVRRQPVPILQPDDLPALAVFISSQQSSRDGEGFSQFERTIVIGISVLRGYDEPQVLEGQIDGDIALVEDTLLTDPTFNSRGPGALFQSIEQINVRRLYPQSGETYLCELRLEMTFQTIVDFVPRVPDDFEKLIVETRPLDGSAAIPLLRSEYDQDTD